jgi:hypothetical protein
VNAFAAASSAALWIRRLDKAQKYAPVLYEGDGPTAGLFGRHSDTRTQLRHARLSRAVRARSRVRAALLPVRQELRFCLSYAGRAPARRDCGRKRGHNELSESWDSPSKLGLKAKVKSIIRRIRKITNEGGKWACPSPIQAVLHNVCVGPDRGICYRGVTHSADADQDTQCKQCGSHRSHPFPLNGPTDLFINDVGLRRRNQTNGNRAR